MDVILTNIPYKMAFIWPRQVPYLGVHLYTSDFRIVGTKSLAQFLPQVVSDYPDRQIYLYLCSKDYPDYFFQLNKVDQLDRTTPYFAWKKKIGNEYIFKLADNPKIPQVR